MKLQAMVLLCAWFVAAAGGAAEKHLTLRLEDGLPGVSAALPITIVVPVAEGKGGAGVSDA
jgi:hypothetical protein